MVALRRDIPAEATVEDSKLRQQILSDIRSNLAASASQINVIVRDGAVELWGQVDSSSEKDALRVSAESTAGVRSVADHVSVSRMHHGI
jgi:osmotically-inducible protein OsmY